MIRSSALLITSLLALSACGDKTAPEAPLTAVIVVDIKGHAVPNIVDVPGRIEAVRWAEVRARTDGIVERRLYQEGTDVAAGAPLFLIDARDKKAQLLQARAALSRAIAARDNAASVVRRYGPLVSERAVSALETDAASSQLQQAEASVADARAAVNRAELELSYTTVRAPIAGRVGRAGVTEGALVSATSATLMTRVEQLEPVYAVFTLSSSSISDLLRQARQGSLDLPDITSLEVELQLEDGQTYPIVGRLDFADLTVDPSTGSQTLRARFANPRRQLLPGQFVRAHIKAGTLPNGISVPMRAVQIVDSAAHVTVVGRNNLTQRRPVTLGGQIGSEWVVRNGLRPGDRVIVEGWQKVRAGQKVAPRIAGEEEL